MRKFIDNLWNTVAIFILCPMKIRVLADILGTILDIEVV
ncbi:hypothetical protein CPC197_0481 [Chlamydia psittaci C1/97]|nr:hypothetical protein CPC197_0481 [Chlamydia psittaci C1/97]